MKTRAYIFIKSNGDLRIGKSEYSKQSGEVVVAISLEIPDSEFYKPLAEATIKVKESKSDTPVIEIESSALTDWLKK